jgi:tetratricopeptide (TPR) repeat protein
MRRGVDAEIHAGNVSAKPHAFVAMAFGTKPGADGTLINFDHIYATLIAPALEKAGLEPFRADQERRAGEIRQDMFQELLVADLVVADLTIDNPNVWYELGVRHALRARGIVLICGGRPPTAFDVYTDRKLRYGLKDGGPDPGSLAADIDALADMVRKTMDSWQGRKISPVYSLLPNLQEPDWKSLRIGDVREFWEEHDAWETRIELARSDDRIGDLLVLANEAPVAAFRAEAWLKAGEALRKAARFRFALEHLELGLQMEPTNLVALREKGVCLQRLALQGEQGHTLERARLHYRDVLKLYPKDPETWALLGRIDKDAWMRAWRQPERTKEQKRADATDEEALLRATIDSYSQAFRSDPTHYFSGINALTLIHLYRHLTGDTRYEVDGTMMAGAVRFAATCETREAQMFWAKATIGDLEVLTGTAESVKSAYKEAIAKSERDGFALNSSRAQLQILQDLDFGPDTVAVGIAIFDKAIDRLEKPAQQLQTRNVILFSGHRIDAPDRPEARFPADKEPIAAQKIAEALDQLDAGPEDVALCQAAAGGDLLFIEACQQRGVRCEILLPFAEPEFIERSIMTSTNGEKWCQRFYVMKDKLTTAIRIMPDVLGPLPKGSDPFERCNLWLLYTALASGLDKVRFIALWNGGGSDGPGGTEHMCKEVKRRTGRVTWLDTRKLW